MLGEAGMRGGGGGVRRLAVIEAPSNLGLRPPGEGVVPGVYKLPGALREAGLVGRLGAVERGVVVPPRYESAWDGVRTRNQAALASYTRRLASRVEEAVAAGELAIVLGGDCSVLLGPALALRRRGRYGLVFVDGHSDFRHLGNTDSVQAAAGEDLALVTGRGAPELVDLDGLCPYVLESDVAVVGVRDDDAHLGELRAAGMTVVEASRVAAMGAEGAVGLALETLGGHPLDGLWVHVDADVVDPSHFPAVDAPAPGGIGLDELSALLRRLAAERGMVGLDVTILDPDLDESGDQAAALADVLANGLGR